MAETTLSEMLHDTKESLRERIAALEAENTRLTNTLVANKDVQASTLPRLVSCAIIVRDGQVLLENRAPSGIVGLDNRWDLPGGKVEADETVSVAVVREIKEELGIDVEAVLLCQEPLPSVWIYPDMGPRHWLCVGVVCRIIEGDPVTHERLQWFPIEQLPATILDTDRNLIAQYQRIGKEHNG